MAKAKRATPNPSMPFPPEPGDLHRDKDRLWVPLRNEWRDVSAKPEEVVRQRFIRFLVDDLGYSLDQIDQERRTQHGHRSPRADIVVWASAADKAAGRTPVLVIECKTDGIDIQVSDYYQGESYTRAVGCEFFVATNTRHTAILRLVPGLPGEFVAINEIPKAADWGNAKRLQAIRDALRAFDRKEFQDLLFKCHSILRDVHKMDPGRAFDTISKILFIKMYVERSGQHGKFSTDYLDLRAASRMPEDAEVFRACKTTSGLGTIDSCVMRTAAIPLPPPQQQALMVRECTDHRGEAEHKNAQAAALRQSAWFAFEAALFDPAT